MTPAARGVEQAEKVGLATAKASLSSIVAKVESTGEAVVIMRYNRPVAMVAPIPREPVKGGRARGLLSSYADAGKRGLEAEAFGKAMVSKHARNS